MKYTAIVLVILVLLFTASNIYFYQEVERLDSMNLSQKDIVNIIDDFLIAQEKRKASISLIKLNKMFHLAPTSTPNNRRIYGDVKARYTLMEFADIECAFCRKMHDNIKRVVDQSKHAINWEFKHFPLGGHNPAAAKEAHAIECIAGEYNNRTAWVALEQFIKSTKGNGLGIDDIPSLIRSFGINGSLIFNCLESNDYKEKINSDYEEGRRLGITGTPAILLIDNQASSRLLIRGYKTSEQLLQIIHEFSKNG